ncbi:MAG TPA: HAMP domain-containing sensor histidine kinase [Chroococcales cyanobacterium]
MFQKIKYRLLLSYLVVLTSILVVFAIAVRAVFIHSLEKHYKQKLLAVARSASSDMYLTDGKLRVHTDFDWKELNSHYQALQWFDLQGNLIETRGRNVLDKPFSASTAVQLPLTPEETIPIDEDTEGIEAITWPVSLINTETRIGYVRASQSPEEFNKTLGQLDWGLGGGILLALVFSGVGGILLTRQAMQPIEDSFQRLKQFTADASHELRGPLMAIKSNVKIALKYADGMRDSDKAKFQAVDSAVSQMTHLTEDLLLLARTEQAPSKAHQPVDLGMILDSLLQLYTPQAEEKRIHLKANVPDNLYLLGDPVQLSRLFSNLIENAIKYTPEGGTVEIQTGKEGQQLRVSVRDTGIGIEPENIKHVFDRFWRAAKDRNYRYSSSGLGLAIAQVIAQHHGGLITVTSKVGIGSCFTVRLPTGRLSTIKL